MVAISLNPNAAGSVTATTPAWLKQPERTYVELEMSRPARLEVTGPYGLTMLRDELHRVRAAQVGARNHRLNRSAFAVAQLIAGGNCWRALHERVSCRPRSLSDWTSPSRARRSDSAFRAGLRQPRCAPHPLGSVLRSDECRFHILTRCLGAGAPARTR
jgi:hypothetical protein